MRSISIQSPAKLNLYLKVTGKREDGYHDLDTLFHRISLCDTLIVKEVKKKTFSLSTDLLGLPTDESNLITRAYRLLENKIPDLPGVSVHLKKRIPMGSGLGGGSSNAAYFLLAMNEMLALGLSRRQLLILGRKLGADVPFFIYNKNQAVATGRGDVIRVHESKAKHRFLLLLSNEALSTPEVFKRYRLRSTASTLLTKKHPTGRLLCTFLDGKRYSEIAISLLNDLEKPAFLIRPEVRDVMDKIKKEGFEAVRMSGSGPTVFALLPDDRDGNKMLSKVKRLLPSIRVELVETY